MTRRGKTYKDQRKHRRKVRGTARGAQEHQKRNARRANDPTRYPEKRGT